jgi:hypothetical protein
VGHRGPQQRGRWRWGTFRALASSEPSARREQKLTAIPGGTSFPIAGSRTWSRNAISTHLVSTALSRSEDRWCRVRVVFGCDCTAGLPRGYEGCCSEGRPTRQRCCLSHTHHHRHLGALARDAPGPRSLPSATLSDPPHLARTLASTPSLSRARRQSQEPLWLPR